MTIDSMENVAATEQEIIERLASVEDDQDHKHGDKPKENEEAEFDKLHSMLPYLTSSKSVTQLDIVLEAITYINMLQNKLVENIQ